jgi:hypothetical protein
VFQTKEDEEEKEEKEEEGETKVVMCNPYLQVPGLRGGGARPPVPRTRVRLPQRRQHRHVSVRGCRTGSQHTQRHSLEGSV